MANPPSECTVVWQDVHRFSANPEWGSFGIGDPEGVCALGVRSPRVPDEGAHLRHRLCLHLCLDLLLGLRLHRRCRLSLRPSRVHAAQLGPGVVAPVLFTWLFPSSPSACVLRSRHFSFLWVLILMLGLIPSSPPYKAKMPAQVCKFWRRASKRESIARPRQRVGARALRQPPGHIPTRVRLEVLI